jgi:DNA-directed RNA polymerase subunit RPC12/RpoP
MARVLLAFLVMVIGLLAARRLMESAPSAQTAGSGGGAGDDRHYRPRARARRRDRAQPPPPYNARSIVRRSALTELRDALSGGPLDADAELFRCADCKSFYSVQSVRALAMDNGARCINCGSIDRIAVEVVD